MDMLSFFRLLVPSKGFHFITEWVPKADHPRGGVMPHYPFADLDDMEAKARELDAKGKNSYYALASYKEVVRKTTPGGYEYVAGRTKDNAYLVRCLWQDFDVGKDDGEKSYASKTEALASLKQYVLSVGLPDPVVVDSGYGLHAYWPFDCDIDAKDWERIASLQRVIFKHLKVKFDPARDKDCASVLRPIGTHNYKEGKPAREVKLLTLGAGANSPVELEAKLSIYISSNGLTVPMMPSAPSFSAFGLFATDDLSAVEYPDSSLAKIAEHCLQVKHFSETGGESEPEWYANLGLAKHCIDGEEVAHAWAAKHAGYDRAQTQSKMDQWTYGPTTCAKFADTDGHRCDGCPHAEKVKSPIQLGYTEEHKAPTVSVVETVTTVVDNVAQPEEVLTDMQPEHWPKAVQVRNGVMCYSIPDDDGVVQSVPFAAPMFWPTERIRMEDGTYAFSMSMVVKKDAPIRKFDLPIKTIVDGKSLRVALGAYECIVFNDKLAVKYMSDYSSIMRQARDEKHTFQQFGWRDEKFDAFLIGNTLITKDATSNVLLSEKAIVDPDLHKAFNRRGEKETWIAGVHTLYNREHGEPYQYTICTVFGSVLVPLLGYDEWNGIPLALTTENSGFGKSTVAKIAINALSDATKTTLSNTTAKALVHRASTMKNLVMLFDEVSDKNANELRDILYSLSNGHPRVGMQADGRERKPAPPWKLNSIITGNRNIYFKLTEAKDNPEATQMRVFEIDLESLPILESVNKSSKLHAEHHEIALNLVNNVSGVLAEEYIRFVITHAEEIKAKLHNTAMAFSKELGGEAAKERFYAYHMACSLVGGWIARKLGFIDFNLNALKKWAFNHVVGLRGVAEECRNTPADKLSAILSDLHGSLVVTKRFETLNAAIGVTEQPLYPVKTPVAGRVVLGDPGKEAPRVFLTSKAVDEWCRDHGVNALQVRREFEMHNLLRNHNHLEGGKRRRDRPVSIGRGIPGLTLGAPRCLEFSFSAAQGFLETLDGGNPNVIEFPVKKDPPGSSEAVA